MIIDKLSTHAVVRSIELVALKQSCDSSKQLLCCDRVTTCKVPADMDQGHGIIL